MSLFDQIQTDMYAAMKAREKEKSGTLRITLAKLKDKRIEKREDLSEEEEMKILQTLVKQRKESIELYEKGDREDLVNAEKNEMKILNGYLAKMMSEDDIRSIVQTVVKEVGATSMAVMGRFKP